MVNHEHLNTTIELGLHNQHLVRISSIIDITAVPRRPEPSGAGRRLINIFSVGRNTDYYATYSARYPALDTLVKIIFPFSRRKDLIKVFKHRTVRITAEQFFDLMENYDIKVRRP